MTKKYEYRIIDYERIEGHLQDDLNEYGSDGWELVSNLPLTLAPTSFKQRERTEIWAGFKMLRLIFKRELG